VCRKASRRGNVSGGMTSLVLPVCVCVCVCQQDYSQSNHPISLKLDIMIGPTDGKNQLTFGGDPAPD